MRLARPTLIPRSSAMRSVMQQHLSERYYRYTELAIEYSSRGIVARTLRIVFEHHPAIELQAAGRQPVAQHRGPCLFNAGNGALETESGVFAAWDSGLERVANRRHS